MDLPPSGWYPDPYGTPALLRWWDGSGWTHHTHAAEAAAGGMAGMGATRVQPGLQPTTVQPGVQPTTVQPGVPATTVQAAVPRSAAGEATRIEPSTGALRRAEPPTGPPTSPQPALPDTTVQAPARPAGYQAAAYQPAVTMVQPPAGAGADGTQVLFLGADAWQVPGGGPGGQGPYGYGYQDARRRRRRRWLMGGLAGGTTVALGVIAVLVAGLGSSPAARVADQTRVTPSSASSSTAPATTASPSPSASPSASTSAPAATLSDAQSGLSYAQLGSPWQAGCPVALTNGAFTWTSGEFAVAGLVNGGQSTWYGEACSGPLPRQYGYTGVAALESTATNLVNTFQGSYYSALAHTATPEASQPVTVSGHPGWEITYAVTYTNAQAQGVTWSGEQAAVVMVDAGTGNAPAVFFTSIPASLGESNVAALVASLQLSARPSAGGTPTGTAPVTGTGPPASPGPPSDGGSPNDGSPPANP